jgi:hypothetical protein
MNDRIYDNVHVDAEVCGITRAPSLESINLVGMPCCGKIAEGTKGVGFDICLKDLPEGVENIRFIIKK